MIAAGIDYNTRSIDIATTDGKWWHCELKGDTAFDRLRDVRRKMPDEAWWWTFQGIAAVGIEEPQGAQRAAIAKLKAVQGAIVACLPSSLLVAPLMPAEWRKAVGLPGGASKEDVATFVNQGKPWPPARQDWPQDACDAYCIARAVQSRLREGEPA